MKYGCKCLVGFELVDVTHKSANESDVLSVGNVVNLLGQAQICDGAHTQECPNTHGSMARTAVSPLRRKKTMMK